MIQRRYFEERRSVDVPYVHLRNLENAESTEGTGYLFILVFAG